jgi:hypothetical protein
MYIIYKYFIFIVNLSFEIKPRDFGRHTTLNAKVIETWINETLLDAEHLDIPGIVLKPEHKNPVSRYSIDRLTLTVTYTLIFIIYRMLVFKIKM